MADLFPEHSSTTSTARSAIRSGSHAGKLSRSSGSSTSSAPRSRASCARRSPAPPRRRADAPGHQRGDGQRPDGPGPDDHDRSPASMPGAGDAVEGHRQRFGQRRLSGGEPRGQAHQRAGAAPVRTGRRRRRRRRRWSPAASHWDGLPSRQRRHVRTGARARPTTGSPSAHPSTPCAHGGHGSRVLVAGDQTGLAGPALEQQVDVRAADPAVVDLDQHLAGPGRGTGRCSTSTSPGPGRRRRASCRAVRLRTPPFLPRARPVPPPARAGQPPSYRSTRFPGLARQVT